MDEVDSVDLDSPLHLATRHANNEMVAILLRKGANADLSNKVVLYHTFYRKCKKIYRTLFTTIMLLNLLIFYQNMECPLHESIRLRLVSTAQLLLRGGASVNIEGPNGKYNAINTVSASLEYTKYHTQEIQLLVDIFTLFF